MNFHLTIKTKFVLLLLSNVFLVGIISFLSVIYVNKIQNDQIKISRFNQSVNDIGLHTEEHLNAISMYSVSDRTKFDSLKSETDFSTGHIGHALEVLHDDPNLKGYISSITDITDSFRDLGEKIYKNRLLRSDVDESHKKTLSELMEVRHKMLDMSAGESEEIATLSYKISYFEKEFNFEDKNAESADRWIESISELASKKTSKEFSETLSEYAGLSKKCVDEINALLDLDYNFGFFLIKENNAFVESKIQNSKVNTYISSMVSDIKAGNEAFKRFAMFAIIGLLIMSTFFSIFFFRNITKPIYVLNEISKKILGGDYSVRSLVNSNDEMGTFSKTLNKMLDFIDLRNRGLKNESERLKTLLSSIGEGLLLIDANYKILLANNAASIILRTPPKELIGKNLKDSIQILHEMDTVPTDKWPFEHVFKTKRPLSLKLNDGYYFKADKGRIFPVEITIAPIESESSKGIAIIFKDVTEMKLIEEEREFSSKNLESVLKSVYIERDNVQEEKDKLEALLNSMGDAVLAIDEEKNVIAFNPVAEKITGLTRNEFGNEIFSKKISFIEEETKKRKDDFIDKVLLAGEKAELNDLAIINKKGKMILIDINAAPIKYYKENIIGCIIIFKDVTFKREAERMRTDFISIVSHQLRTPLSAMKWFLEILLDGDVGKLKKEQMDVVSEIHESNNNMINFVNQMLNVSRIESRRLAINIEKIRLCDTIGELLKEILPFFKEKKQKLSYNCIADKNLEINTDKNLLRNVLSSILLNASRYTPEKGNIDLEVSKYDKDFVQFRIKDDGIGIPEDEQVKIFRKFARASNAIRYEANGTGLGLYIVKSIINMVCGKIWFESEENKGTTFYFTLPIENMVCEIDEGDRKMLI